MASEWLALAGQGRELGWTRADRVSPAAIRQPGLTLSRPPRHGWLASSARPLTRLANRSVIPRLPPTLTHHVPIGLPVTRRIRAGIASHWVPHLQHDPPVFPRSRPSACRVLAIAVPIGRGSDRAVSLDFDRLYPRSKPAGPTRRRIHRRPAVSLSVKRRITSLRSRINKEMPSDILVMVV